MATYYSNGETDLDTIPSVNSFTDGEILIFATGAQTVSTNLTELDGASKNANQVKWARAFTGSVNASMVFACSNGTRPRVWHDAGGGTVNAKPRSGGTWTKLLITGSGTFNLTGETVTDAELGSGTLAVDVSAVVTNVYVAGGVYTCGYNATAHTIFEQHGGTAGIQRAITTGNFAGGVSTIFSASVSSTQPTGGTIRASGDHTMNWRGGAITTLYVTGDATFDSSQAPVGGAITNLFTTPAARARSNFTNMTITNFTPLAEAYRAAP